MADPEVRVRTIVTKQDGVQTPPPPGAIVPQAMEQEDEFEKFYENSKTGQGSVLKPPYDLTQLETLVSQNMALGPCLDAMETNIDGTGAVIEPLEPAGEDGAPSDEQKSKAEAIHTFFDEPWPGMSFLTIRRRIRRDIEATGNAYLEVLRNLKDEVVFARRVDPKTMRLVKLDDPTPVDIEVERGGKTFKAQVMIRERRYAQAIQSKLLYFRDFKTSRQLDKMTGKWAEPGEKVDPDKRATEIIHFTNKPDAKTPYGVPRWIGQTPSVIGTRKAEEYNLDFFNAGGIPPMLITVEGGTLGKTAEAELRRIFSGKGSAVHEAAIIEAVPTSGSIDSPGTVRVHVERFGRERQKDGMFENYTETGFQRIRTSFRLPELFLGRSEDLNFACYDEETEFLSNRGWLTHDQYQQGDRIACVDPETGLGGFMEPKKLLRYSVKDVSLYRGENQSTAYAVTEGHTMLWRTATGHTRSDKVQDLPARFEARHGLSGWRGGEKLEDFAPPWAPLKAGKYHAADKPPAPLPAGLFLRLLGWYVSEGHVHPAGTSVAVTQKPGRDEAVIQMFEELAACGYRTRYSEDVFQFHLGDKSWAQWFLAECGKGSANKRLPEWALDLPQAQARVLFTTLMAGDGSWDSRPTRNSGAYATTSEVLAGQVQTLALQLGYRATVRQDAPGTEGHFPIFRVLLSALDQPWSRVMPAHQERSEPYTGMVWCFETVTGFFVTRRNGKVAVQGNTAVASYTVAEAQVFRPERLEFDEIITLNLLPELDPMGAEYVYKSLPISVKNVTETLEALALAKDAIDNEQLVAAINEAADLDLEPREEEEEETRIDPRTGLPVKVPAGGPPAGSLQPAAPGAPPGQEDDQQPVLIEARDLAPMAVRLVELLDKNRDATENDELGKLMGEMATMSPAAQRTLTHMMAIAGFGDRFENDPEGLGILMGCTAEVLSQRG